MVAKISCPCGASYKSSPKLAGKKVRCKRCKGLIHVPAAKKSSRKRSREDKALSKYAGSGKMSLDERMALRQRETMEEERVPNAVKHVLIGIGCLIAAVVVYFVLNALENGGVAPRIVWVFVLLKGKFWIPPLLGIVGLYQFFMAYWYLFRTLNVDD